LSVLATMESHARGANRLVGYREPRLLSAHPHAGQTGSPSVVSEQLVEGRESGFLDSKSLFERTMITPDAPGDARELIGEGDGSHVVAVSVFDTECPSA